MLLLTLLTAVAVSFSSATRVSLTQTHKSQPLGTAHKLVSFAASGNNQLGLSTSQDLIYMANVTIGGIDYVVQLDTGSSDLWVKGSTTPLPNTKPTDAVYNLTYGIGWAQGHLSYATVEFAGVSVPSQAFLDASDVQNPATSYGAVGILGLGFTSLSSLDHAVNSTGSSSGRSLLYNLFNDNPSEPNFISFALQRSTEPGDEVEGSFTIGEYEPAYAAVADKDAIPTWPVKSPKRWTVLVDALLTNGQAITPSTSVPNAPSNRAVALLDSGTSWSYAPPEICTAIYGGISGASYNSQTQQWQVPCDAEVDIALQIGGQIFPLHPLDVTPNDPSGSKTCVGSFVPQSVSVGANQFDWLIGDNFLRSVYSVYDFGDFDANHNMGDPYIKLLSLVDPNIASAEFVKVRGGTARTNITYNASNTTVADSTSMNLSSDVEKTLDRISIYFPAMLGFMALNALVLTALLVVGAVYLCRRRRKRARTARIRTPNGRLTPMPANARNSYIAGSPPPGEHIYEPISMAITEDTMFNPPSPGFRHFDDRPKSLATLPSQSKLYQQIGSEDALVAPSPSFAKDDGRPKSMGMDPSVQPNFGAGYGQDEPFTPPVMAMAMQDQVPDNMSLRSGKSGRSLVDDGVVPRPSQESLVTTVNPDRPRSIAVPPPLTQSPEDVLLPPSPGLSSGFSTGEKPNSATVPTGPIAPKYPPPPIPQSASPRFATGSTLRPNAAAFAAAERPMSVGMLPSQMQNGRYMPSSPPFRRQGSSLRPDATFDRPMSAVLPAQQQIPAEEDITSFPPPRPAFRRQQSGPANDRPMSFA